MSSHDSYMGIDRDRGCQVIWNELRIADSNRIKVLFEEFIALKSLKHENINSVLDTWITKEKIVFMTESWAGSSIRAFLGKIGAQKKKVVKTWIIMILKGLQYIHKLKYVYKYLNCGKLIYNPVSGNVSIGDLFFATENFNLEGNNNLNNFPFEWYCPAPEVINNEKISEKADVFSLGMAILEMITLELPYIANLKRKGIKKNHIYSKESISTVRKLITSGVKPLCLQRMSDDEEFRIFIEQMIAFNPEDRPSVEQLLSDKFLEVNKNKDNLELKLLRLKKKEKKQVPNDTADFFHSDVEMKNFLKYYVLEEVNVKTKLTKKIFREKPYFEDQVKAQSKDKKPNYCPQKNDAITCNTYETTLSHDFIDSNHPLVKNVSNELNDKINDGNPYNRGQKGEANTCALSSHFKDSSFSNIANQSFCNYMVPVQAGNKIDKHHKNKTDTIHQKCHDISSLMNIEDKGQKHYFESSLSVNNSSVMQNNTSFQVSPSLVYSNNQNKTIENSSNIIVSTNLQPKENYILKPFQSHADKCTSFEVQSTESNALISKRDSSNLLPLKQIEANPEVIPRKETGSFRNDKISTKVVEDSNFETRKEKNNEDYFEEVVEASGFDFSSKKIFNQDKNLTLKFIVNENNKSHTIEFDYCLAKDNVTDIINELRFEFSFAEHIYVKMEEFLSKVINLSEQYKCS